MSAPKVDIATVKKWLRYSVVALLAAYAVYLVAIHVVLATPLLRHFANKKPEKFLLEYGSAWSIIPGRVHVRALRIRFKDSVAETYLSIDKVDTTVELLPLAKKILRFRGPRLSNASVRVRPRMHPEDVRESSMQGMATIPGFDGPPLAKTEPREPPELDKYWTIDLQNAEIDLRELWIDTYRFAGRARATGGFFLKPTQEFELRPSRIEVTEGVLTLANRPFGRELRGSLEARIARHDPRALDGGEMFRHMDVHAKLASVVDELGFVQKWLAPGTGTHLTGGGGSAESEVHVVAGVLRDGTWLTFKSQRALVRHPPFSAWVDSDVDLRVAKGVASVRVLAHDLRLVRRWAESYPIESERIDLLVVTRSLDLARKPFDDVLATLDVPRATMTNTRMLTGLFGEQVKLQGGAAYLKAHVDLSVAESLLKGTISFDAPRLAAASSSTAFAARVAVGLEVERLDLSTMTGSVPRAYVDVRDANLVGLTTAPPPAWWGRVELRHGTLDAAQKPMFAGDLSAHARDARPIVFLATQKQGIPAWAREPLAMENLRLHGKLHVGPGVAVEALTGDGGAIDVDGRLAMVNRKNEGHVTLSYGPLALTIHLGPRGAVGGGPKNK